MRIAIEINSWDSEENHVNDCIICRRAAHETRKWRYRKWRRVEKIRFEYEDPYWFDMVRGDELARKEEDILFDDAEGLISDDWIENTKRRWGA